MQDEHRTESASDGYERYFGLAESPFTLTSSPRFLFESASYRAAFKEIFYALTRREQIIVVTGPIGTGKTTLCRMIIERKDPRTLVAAISMPPQSVDDLFRQILDGFDLLTDDTRSIVEASRYGLQRVFRQFLDSLVALKAQAILVFDEAQLLRPEILEEIRLLLNLDPDRQLLQIVLVGQPELEALLARPELTQIEQRISRRHRLEPLQIPEVPAYVDRRLTVAQDGERAGERPSFSESAIQTIATLSRGVPRVVNILCDRALENAWSEQTHTVDSAAVVRAARSLSIDVPPEVVPTVAPVPAPPAPAVASIVDSMPAAVREPASRPPAEAPAPAIPRALAPPVAAPPVAASPVAVPPPAPSKPSASASVGSRASATRFSSPSTAPSAASLSRNTSVRVKRSHVPIAIAAVVAGLLIVVWIVRGGLTGERTPDPTPQPEAARPASASTPPAQTPPRTQAPPAAATAPRTSAVPIQGAPSSGAEAFVIIVSSFRTRDRATQVATDIVAIGLPASVRSASGWEQVVVGPYASRQQAATAQSRLETAHFADTKLTQTSP